MIAILVAVFCGLLFIFMRSVGGVLGETIGTAAGVGCLGLIAFGCIALVVIVLLPILLPILIFGLICYALFLGLRTFTRSK